ncbi:MAG: hypothetical protein K2N87_03600 [Eubacterium sp.]|nr:hypothetical protein [Eubacterium sp.]
MKNGKKKVFASVFIAVALIAAITVCIGYVYVRKADQGQTKEQKQGFKLNDDGTVTLGLGYSAHGFFTTDGNLVNSGDDILCEDGYIRGQIEFQKNLTEPMEYGLIIMNDFMQKKFAVDNEWFDCYRFSLSGNGTIKIAVEVPVEDNAYEMEYLIVPEPDAKNFSMDNESGWHNFLATKEVSVSSYRITDKTGKRRVPPVFDQIDTEKLEELESEGNTGFELVKSSKDVSAFASAKSGSHACMCLGSMRKEVDAYAVIAFCDWKQTEITKGQWVRCYTSVPDKNYFEEIILPNEQEDAVYQMFAFELPIESRLKTLVYQTFRIKLERS